MFVFKGLDFLFYNKNLRLISLYQTNCAAEQYLKHTHIYIHLNIHRVIMLLSVENLNLALIVKNRNSKTRRIEVG